MAAALAVLAVWAVAAAALWLHVMAGIPGDYIGQGYLLYPGLKVTAGRLAADALVATLPAALAAGLARWRRIRAVRPLALPVLGLLWLGAADTMVQPFTIDFGTTWSGTEPLRALFLHPVHTPLALAALMVAGSLAVSPRRRERA